MALIQYNSVITVYDFFRVHIFFSRSYFRGIDHTPAYLFHDFLFLAVPSIPDSLTRSFIHMSILQLTGSPSFQSHLYYDF